MHKHVLLVVTYEAFVIATCHAYMRELKEPSAVTNSNHGIPGYYQHSRRENSKDSININFCCFVYKQN